MVRSISVIVTLITIGLSQAFESTSPLLAWSNDESVFPLKSVALFSPIFTKRMELTLNWCTISLLG